MLELFLTSTYPSVCILNKDVGLLSCICAVFLKLETSYQSLAAFLLYFLSMGSLTANDFHTSTENNHQVENHVSLSYYFLRWETIE